MRTQLVRKSFILSSVLFLAFFTINWSPINGINVKFQSAHAAVGNPLSAGSVAGVNRRHNRRDAAATNQQQKNQQKPKQSQSTSH